MYELTEKYRKSKQIVIFRTRQEAERYLHGLDARVGNRPDKRMTCKS